MVIGVCMYVPVLVYDDVSFEGEVLLASLKGLQLSNDTDLDVIQDDVAGLHLVDELEHGETPDGHGLNNDDR